MSKYRQQSQKLAELRDWLLPMLMNGQVRGSMSQFTIIYNGNATQEGFDMPVISALRKLGEVDIK